MADFLKNQIFGEDAHIVLKKLIFLALQKQLLKAIRKIKCVMKEHHS